MADHKEDTVATAATVVLRVAGAEAAMEAMEVGVASEADGAGAVVTRLPKTPRKTVTRKIRVLVIRLGMVHNEKLCCMSVDNVQASDTSFERVLQSISIVASAHFHGGRVFEHTSFKTGSGRLDVSLQLRPLVVVELGLIVSDAEKRSSHVRHDFLNLSCTDCLADVCLLLDSADERGVLVQSHGVGLL